MNLCRVPIPKKLMENIVTLVLKGRVYGSVHPSTTKEDTGNLQ